mmetsp:Transcript_18700/g.53946  ORF Transcript_18700/g.53946 Transcript_18700/m.53946 type:complete len:295 (+) Transcript_18700:1623-2507(+)
MACSTSGGRVSSVLRRPLRLLLLDLLPLLPPPPSPVPVPPSPVVSFSSSPSLLEISPWKGSVANSGSDSSGCGSELSCRCVARHMPSPRLVSDSTRRVISSRYWKGTGTKFRGTTCATTASSSVSKFLSSSTSAAEAAATEEQGRLHCGGCVVPCGNAAAAAAAERDHPKPKAAAPPPPAPPVRLVRAPVVDGNVTASVDLSPLALASSAAVPTRRVASGRRGDVRRAPAAAAVAAAERIIRAAFRVRCRRRRGRFFRRSAARRRRRRTPPSPPPLPSPPSAPRGVMARDVTPA